MNVDLALVVGGAASVEIAIADLRVEGRRGPEVQGFGGLHIIVTVEKNGGLARGLERFGIDDRVKIRGNDFNGLETGGTKMIGNPVGGALDVRLMLAFSTDGRDTKKLAKFGEVLFPPTFDEISKVHKGPSGTRIYFQVNYGSSLAKKIEAAEKVWSKKQNAIAANLILRRGGAAHKLRGRIGMTCGEHLSERAIDRLGRGGEDERMTELAQSAQRRSQRVFHKMRLQALGRSHEGRKFREMCETLVVSAHGGLLNLRHEVNNGEMLVLVNPETQEEQECRIVYLGDSGSKGIRVGVEFLTPAPHFWGIDFEATARIGPEDKELTH